MTTEQLLALPDDGVDRDLIRGKLVEKPAAPRNRRHSRTEANLACLLERWLELQPDPRGEVLCGGVGLQLRHDLDTTVGVDLAYISAETVELTPEDAYLIDGIPILVVEILSPNDQQEDILSKLGEYLDCGVKLVWLAEPVFRTITVFRPDTEPQMFNSTQELSAEPHLPGFRMPVAAAFARSMGSRAT